MLKLWRFLRDFVAYLINMIYSSIYISPNLEIFSRYLSILLLLESTFTNIYEFLDSNTQ